MLHRIWGTFVLLMISSRPGFGSPLEDTQTVFASSQKPHGDSVHHVIEERILAALDIHADPVDALVSLRPELAEGLAEPRLLHVLGESQPGWRTEGEKLRLRRNRKKFMDITDHQDFYAQQIGAAYAQLYASAPDKTFVRADIDAEDARCPEAYDELLQQIIDDSPFGTRISLEYFTHRFPQPSIIARFEPKVRNFSLPLTILGAHQDSANYLFPLLPAPGADDDCSGTVSILEAFRILALSGYTPKDGPVEFHWYAAEEGGLMGSQDIARYKKESGATIGAMIELVSRQRIKAPPETQLNRSGCKEYISIPAAVFDLGPNAGSDYMSFTKLDFPAAFASEGDPMAGGFPGEMDKYVHTVKDTMDVDDETGYFSLDHMARFSELAIAFAVEQAGWDNQWR
ncbi:putative peptidase family m28 [Phaeomoniella chlamydospora]|uniref:Peptide hydrolase n=1 Tax=Phaeomoniella chlamydospora TaxID=158046 RepID=A0A0G2H464_PHACM|nr:putative peptidase family m28 [Phaeomoniella chlamydospora]